MEQEDLKQAFEYLPCGVVVASTAADGNIQYINREFTGITGYALSDVPTIEAWLLNAYPDEAYRTEVLGNWERDVSEPGRDVIYRVRCKDGSDKELLLRAGLLPQDRMVVALLDFSETRRVERKLRESEERFRQIAETVDQVFWIHGINPEVMEYVSPAFEKIWGRPVDDLYADPHQWSAHIVEEDRADVSAAWDRALAGEVETVDFTYRITRPDGEIRWIEDRGTAVRDSEGQVIRLVGIAKDVTARKHAENERQQLVERMQSAQKMRSLGVLAGGVAHDFNNLMLGVLGNATLALSRLSSESPVRDNIEGIELAAKHAAELAKQLLAYSGKGHFVLTRLHLQHLVERTVHLLESAVSKKAKLRFDFAPQVPAIKADATQVRQVLMNLVANASDALDDRSGVITIATGVVTYDPAQLPTYFPNEGLKAGRYSYLQVSDTGQGMDEETRSRAFEPFFTTKFTGRGLGLAAAMGIVTGHCGAIEIQSEPGEGTTFKVLFPAVKDGVVTEAELAEDEPTTSGQKHTILLVDDEEIVRTVVRQMLEHVGHNVIAAEDGPTAISRFRDHRDEVACVILDLTMPKMDGMETFKVLRQIDPDVKVLLSSGYNTRDAVDRFSDADLAGFIQKPYTLAALLKSIRTIVS